MMVEEALQEPPQESITDNTEEKSVPHKGWGALVTFMALSIYTVTVAYTVSFGMIFSEYLMKLQTSFTKVSWIYNMFHVISCLGSVVGATLVEELGWRKVMFASGLLCSLGLALSAFTTSADFLFFSYSILAAFAFKRNFCWKAISLALCGLDYGVTFSLNTMVIIEIMGTDMLLPVLGVCGLLSAVWHLTIGPLIGVIIDVYESYPIGLFFLAGLQFFATAVWGLLPIADAVCKRPLHNTRNQEHQHKLKKQPKQQQQQQIQQQEQQQQQQQYIPQPLREDVSFLRPAAARPVSYDSVVQ